PSPPRVRRGGPSTVASMSPPSRRPRSPRRHVVPPPSRPTEGAFGALAFPIGPKPQIPGRLRCRLVPNRRTTTQPTRSAQAPASHLTGESHKPEVGGRTRGGSAPGGVQRPDRRLHLPGDAHPE